MYNILICDDEADIISALKIYLASPDMKFFEAKVDSSDTSRYFNVLDIFFKDEYNYSDKCMTIYYEGKEDETYWWDNDTDEAKSLDFWDEKRKILIHCLKEGYFFDETKPSNYTFGVWHC